MNFFYLSYVHLLLPTLVFLFFQSDGYLSREGEGVNIVDELMVEGGRPKKKGGGVVTSEFKSISVGRTHVTSGCMHENEVIIPNFLPYHKFQTQIPYKSSQFSGFRSQ